MNILFDWNAEQGYGLQTADGRHFEIAGSIPAEVRRIGTQVRFRGRVSTYPSRPFFFEDQIELDRIERIR